MDLTYPSFEGLRRYPSAAEGTRTELVDGAAAPKPKSPQIHDIQRTKAVIIMGGPKDGTRFRPLSLNHPKPLFPIAGVPMIHHHLEACAQMKGMNEIILLGVFPEAQVAGYAAAASQRLGIPVKYLREFQPLGTAGGLYFFRDLIMTNSPDALLVIHADICSDIPVEDLVHFHASIAESANHMTVMSTTARKDMAKKLWLSHCRRQDF
jgi:mannose-1-phosphate guanylyltransferase